jgi:hypothetical protein
MSFYRRISAILSITTPSDVRPAAIHPTDSNAQPELTFAAQHSTAQHSTLQVSLKQETLMLLPARP